MLRLEPLGHLSYIMIMPLNRVNSEAFISHLRTRTQSIETKKIEIERIFFFFEKKTYFKAYRRIK